MIRYCLHKKVGEIMDNIYGIIVKHSKKENYGFPYDSLENIDLIMTNNSKEKLINEIKEANIIPYLSEESDISVGILKDKKWIERKIIPTITDAFILNYPFTEIFMEHYHEYKTYLYTQLSYLVDKNYISDNFKKAILSLKKEATEFINLYKSLAYEEQRLIRYTLAKGFDLKKEDKLLLQRTKEEK